MTRTQIAPPAVGDRGEALPLRDHSRRRRGRARCRIGLLAAAAALAFVALATTAGAAPDLTVESVDLDPTSGPNGTAVEIAARIRNQGDAAAAASTARIRINQSSGSVSSSDTILCSSVATSGLAAGAAIDVSCSATLNGRPAGANYIWAIADVNAVSGDEQPSNNRANAQFTIDNGAPDLVVQSITATPPGIPNGAATNISVSVKNQGSGNALASTTRIRINQDSATVLSTDTALCSISTPGIAAGATQEAQCKPSVSGRPAGTNYLWAIVDVNKTAGQDDTTNDRANTPLEISATASDLVVDSVVVDPVAGANGNSVNVTGMIRNQGSATALSSLTRVRINQNPDTVVGSDPAICDPIDTPSIPIGGTTQIKCKGTPTLRPAGVNYVWVIADSTNTAGQSDRSNDRKHAEYAVDPPLVPDMTVRTLTVSPTSGPNGGQITVTARIANDGEVASPASKTRIVINQNPDGVETDDTVLCDQISTVALSPGASIQVNCKPTPTGRPAGSNFIWAIADATGVSGQTVVDNDMLSASFNVTATPAPDLVVQNVVASPTSAGAGASVSITATIKNQGNASAVASTASIRLGASASAVQPTDPVVCGGLPTPVLGAGSSTNVDCDWVIGDEPPGAAYLWATADVNNTAGQVDRSNDSAKTAFTIQPPDGPDLTIQRLVVRPTSAHNGDSIVVKARVANVGNQDADASVTTFRINLDPDSVDESDDVLCEARPTASLAPGGSVRVRCATTISERPVGANSIWAIVDTAGTSGQQNLRNDRRHTTLTVTSSDCANPLVPPVMAWPIEQPRPLQDYATYGSVPLAGGKLGYHSGIDLRSLLPLPTTQVPVYAAADGEVVAVHKNCPSPADPVVNPPSGVCAAGWGNYVVVRHGDGVYSVYAHLGEVFATTGCVLQGERLALAGSSGSTTIPVHLHFDVLADLVEPVARKALGNEYYRKLHPFVGRVPENETGLAQVHLDARDFMTRNRVRITQNTSLSSSPEADDVVAFVAKDQQYISYGELAPGMVCIDLPNATLPEDGPPYGDGVRYGWIPAANVLVLETGLMPSSARIDGYSVFVAEGVGANFVVLRDQPTDSSAEVSKAWGDQQFAPSGAAVAEAGSGKLWQPVDVPGTTATGTGKPRKAYLPADLLGPPPAY